MANKQGRIAAIIHKNIADIIQFELKNPHLGFVTVPEVKVSNDHSYAKVYVSFINEKDIKEGLEILEKSKDNSKKKMENIIFLIIILIVTILVINSILKGSTDENEENKIDNNKILADLVNDKDQDSANNNLEEKLEKILSAIKGVGKVHVFINYSESSQVIAMYDEKTTKSSTEETDSSGGLRNTTATETQKDVIFSEENGNHVPMTEKIIMPTIEGAIITAEGAANGSVKTNIVSAVEAVTGLTIDKIQVFETK